MKRYLAAVVALLALTSIAEARPVHQQPSRCFRTDDVMRPCVANPNFLAGVRSIRVHMRREASQPRVRQVRAHRPVREASAPRPVKHVIQKVVEAVEQVQHASGNGVVRAASGAVAYVAGQATGAFQCLIDKLEGQGYRIKEMGGFARGGHIRGSLHYSGMALDVNQIQRNVTRPAMPSNEIALANSCGLVSGAQWANGDSGHFQLGGYAGSTRRHYAQRHVRHRRYASR